MKQLREAIMDVPPYAEQTRIAAKLDELLAQVDTLKARIDGIPALLKRFRQSVLAAAISGRLTEEWRILRVDSAGEEKTTGWMPKSLPELGELARGKSKHRPRNDERLFGGKYPFIQTGEVANSAGRIKTAKVFYSDFGLAQSRLFPKGTLCITIAANIADTAILDMEACFPDSVVGFVADEEKCCAQFVKYLIDVNKQNLEAFAPATAQKNINLKVLSELVFPMPPLAEQTEIVRHVEQLFAFADQLEAKVNEAKTRIDRLTQSILAKAFRGELVAQDPDDEPASVLLERIQAQRAAAPKAKRKRRVGAD
ncbi:restriction endonuclease subunit S [Azotobacter chroococcum]|nr:restriction endonuclease subunit S [Azotobacter chroococcum]